MNCTLDIGLIKLVLKSSDSFEFLCNINLCLNHCIITRENASTPEVDRDAHITQSYWMEIRHIVRCIYRDSMSLSGEYSF